jgi:hypothetical protein
VWLLKKKIVAGAEGVGCRYSVLLFCLLLEIKIFCCLLRCSSTSGELGCGRRLVVDVVTNGSAVEALWGFTGGAKWWLDGRSVDGVESGLL